jgi:histidine triad (HIT) family protein
VAGGIPQATSWTAVGAWAGRFSPTATWETKISFLNKLLLGSIFFMTIFSKIIAGQIPSFRIAEDEYFFAFLDIAPLREGHTLVVPKIETDKFFDMPDDYLARILLFAKPIALAIEKTFDCNRCGLTVIGLEVPHAHLHLIPIDSIHDMDFTKHKLKPSPEELKATQKKLLSHFH